MYTLQSETDTRRSYLSSITGTEVFTTKIYTDESGNDWWGFEDLLQIPFIRKKAAEKMTQLYGIGFTKEDLNKFTSSIKTVLKSDHPDKYEKAFSEVLNLESIIEETLDPIKEMLSLCSVYILGDNERVDTFNYVSTLDKMNVWAHDLNAQSFFLNWLSSGINDFTRHYKTITEIASILRES